MRVRKKANMPNEHENSLILVRDMLCMTWALPIYVYLFYFSEYGIFFVNFPYTFENNVYSAMFVMKFCINAN